LIFPSIHDIELNEKYETLLKKANDIWDDFTTGNKNKNRRDSKLEPPEPKKKGPKKVNESISNT
jgi:hypothetical protein